MPAPESVLLIKPGSLGDIVHALPALGYMANVWPGTKITWIVDKRWAPLLQGVPHLHATIEFPREEFRGPGGWARSVSWFRSLRELRPSLVIDLQGLMRSALMARASRGQLVVGGTDAREGAGWFYQLHAHVDPAQHAVDRYRAIVAAAGVDTRTPPVFALGPGVLPAVDLPDFYFLLHPLARGAGKSLDTRVVTALASALQPHCVVLAGVGEFSASPPANVLNLLNRTTLAEFIGLARRAGRVISVDSGPAHIAAAVNPRVLAIHTWSDPRRVGPYSPTAHVWQGGEITPQAGLADAGLRPGRNFEPGDVQELADWLLAQPEVASAA
jgi:heptosyltransferase-1